MKPEEITPDKITYLRQLIALAQLPKPADHCEPDCEHIECGFVVACEKYTAAKAKLALLIEPLLDALERARNQEQQTAVALDGFLGDVEKAKNARVPLELTCPKCDMIHIDQGEWAHEIPHRTHLCHGCGNLWKPYPVGTVGVDVHASCRSRAQRLEADVKWTSDMWQQEIEANKQLTARRDELLALVARISQTTPLPSEMEGWESQRAALIAEVGTLRARVTDLEARGDK